METVHKLELILAEHYKKLPHLPENAQKWLAANAWWLVLIGVVIGVFAIFGVLSLLGLALLGLSVGGAVIGSGVGVAIGAAVGGILLITTIISLVLYIVETVLMGLAVAPLKNKNKRGWDLLFIVAVLNASLVVIVGVITFDLFGIIVSLLWIALAVYFLYEIREHFLVKKNVSYKQPIVEKAEHKA